MPACCKVARLQILIALPRPPPWHNPRKGRDQIFPSGNLDEQVRARAEGEVRGRLAVCAVQEVQGGREAGLRGRPGAGVQARAEGGVRRGRAAGEGGAKV